jgi:hypothetical protein
VGDEVVPAPSHQPEISVATQADLGLIALDYGETWAYPPRPEFPGVLGSPEMRLISLPVSPFAARVRIAIYAKELNIEVAPPPAGWPASRQFRELNPTGRIPLLVLGTAE